MAEKVFILKDADFNVAASFTAAEAGAPAYVTIMDPLADQCITMRVDDFLRMAAAVERGL